MSERVVLPTDLVPSHYTLELTPSLDRLDFYCNEEIVVDVVKEVKEVTLHSRDIYVESVSFKSATSNVAPVCEEISYNTKAHTVRFGFNGALPVGAGTLLIKYRGILNGDMAGFYKSTYADADGNKKVMASTQFEALDARRAFICWDEPGMKTTFSVTMTIPAHLCALSNMPELSVTHLSGKLKKVVFDKTPKMSTYLLAFAVGEFDFVEGTTKSGVAIRVYCPPGRSPQCTFALDAGVRALEFYDDFFQVPYPLPKLDMICITEFAMGAMENWGLVTYRETALMVDPKKASIQSKQRVAIVVAHELAHQWFGNLVTMSWWDGLWLNEGFAAFMEHFCVDALYPDYLIWEQFTTGAFGAAQRLDALKSSHPIIVPIKHAEEVEQVFDAISYCKGSTVVNMISAILGKEKFQEGLQLYMKRHAYGNTETIDLWKAWSEVSGNDVPLLMNTWTTKMGYPYLKVINEKWSKDHVEFTLEQNRFLSDGSVEEDCPIWCIPILFATSSSVSADAIIMDKKQQTFSVPFSGEEDEWIKINTGQKALARVAHSPEMIKRLKKGISSKQVSAVDRAALLLDSYALAKAGLAPLETVVEYLRAMEDEDSSNVWSAISGVLNGFFILLEQMNKPDTFAAFMAFGKEMVVKALAKVGWDGRDSDTHTDKLLRSTVLGLLDTFAWDDATVASEAKKRFDEHWTNPDALPAEYKTTVYKIVLMNGGVKEYDQVYQAYYATEDNQERKYTMFTLGSTLDMGLKKKTLDWAIKSGDVKLQDLFYPIGAVSGNVAGSELAWSYYKENFDVIKEMLAKASPSLMDAVIINSVNRFCTAAKADEIEAFFKANPLPQSERRISQSVEVMRTSNQMLEAIAKSKLADASFWTF